MTLKTIYVVRHGDRVWNLVGARTPTGIPGDVALTKHGRDQVKELTWFFTQPFSDDSRPIPDRIYSSAYWRTLETIAFLPCGTDRIYVEPGLGERVLDDGHHPPMPLSQKQIRAFPGIDPDAHKPILLPSPMRETRQDLIARIAEVLDKLIERIERENPEVETILLGTHASPAICIAMALLDQGSEKIHTYTAGVSKYTRARPRRLHSWHLDWNCRVDFLSKGGEADWNWNKDRANLDSAASTPEPSTRHGQRVANGTYSGSVMSLDNEH